MTTEAETVASITAQAIAPFPIEPGTVYTIATEDGGVRIVDTDSYAAVPRQTTGQRKVSDAQSFVAYLEKHGLPQTEVYADTENSKIVAIVDSHRGAGAEPGWQAHRLTLELQHTKSWLAWTKHDGTWFGQTDFAEFIEQRATDVIEPAAGDLMSLAQNFYMTKGVEYESASRLSDGQTTLVYKEKVATRGLGKLEVPKELKLALQPYMDGPRQYAFANFRTRLDGAVLKIGYVLVRPEEILDGVFADIVNELRDGRTAVPDKGVRGITAITHPIYFGKP